MRWTVVLGVLVAVTSLGQGHVGLYNPPARTYALDFLDTARTVYPCGMTRGRGPVTDLEARSTLNISWYLGYAHTGGFRLELLRYDSSGMVNTTLTRSLTSPAGQYIGDNSITTTSHEVTLPADVTSCTNCTIRLLRQALEWGPNYIFWSCADVNILPSSGYTQTCLSHGTYSTSTSSCQCDNTYSGSSCQFKDECVTDTDCGTNGKCQSITTFSYPQRQCFCQPGWFGLKCDKESPLKTSQFDASLYKRRTLSAASNAVLYYRIITTSNELEVVLQANTKSYIGFGWKPLNAVCRQYSLRIGSSEAEGEPETEPEGEPETEPEGRSQNLTATPTPGMPKSTPAPEGEGAAEPGSTTKAPTGEPEGEGEPEGTAEPETGGPGDVNGMDCADIVVGAAVGELSRVRDYYTSDRSTPRQDEFYGGTQSLTAAVANQSADGVTTVIFRRPMTANESTDHSIVNALMTTIWSHGQVNPTIPQFYPPDELKYHGRANRGIVTLNFYDSMSGPTQPNYLRGSWSTPMGCAGMTCNYRFDWMLDTSRDVISFNIIAKQADNLWTGLGIAPEQKMENADVYLGFLDNNQQGVLLDGYIGTRYSPPTRDSVQNVQNVQVSYESGMMRVNFERPRTTNDAQDAQFTNTDCYYFLYPVGGGPLNSARDGIQRHSTNPFISSNKICIRPSGSGPAPPPGGGGSPMPTISMPRDQYNMFRRSLYSYQAATIALAIISGVALIVIIILIRYCIISHRATDRYSVHKM